MIFLNKTNDPLLTICIYCHQLSSVLNAAAWRIMLTPAPTRAPLCSSPVTRKVAFQKAASAIMGMCLMGASVYLTVSVGVFFMVDISR